VFSCDYNGWTDVPEEEREAMEAFEVPCQPPRTARAPLIVRAPLSPAHYLPVRKAA
jgi:hypothetical protein